MHLQYALFLKYHLQQGGEAVVILARLRQISISIPLFQITYYLLVPGVRPTQSLTIVCFQNYWLQLL